MFKAVKNRLIIFLILAAAIAALSVLKNNEYICEYIFTRGISRWYIQVAGSVSSLLPFSLYEILIVIAGIWLIIFLVKILKALRKKERRKAANRILTLFSVIFSFILLYDISATFAYNRYPLNIPLYEEKPANEDITAMARGFMADFNSLAESLERDGAGNVACPYSFTGLADKLKEEYKRLSGGYFNVYMPSPKPMVFSQIMSYMGFSGVFMSVTGEPNINTSIPSMDLPAVMAHEMAHSAGVMRENEANITAYYLLLTSEDGYLRYSGYCSTFGQMLDAVYYADKAAHTEISNSYSQKIIKEYENARIFWEKYNSLLEGITEFINDIYLKSSGISEGKASYENPYDVSDTGLVDEEGETIYEITYSQIQKIYFRKYYG